MLLSVQEIQTILFTHHIQIHNILHLGAFNCEELPIYIKLGIPTEQIVWVEAIPSKVYQALQKGITRILNITITDQDNQTVFLNIANDILSSSVLPMKIEHPPLRYVDRIHVNTLTIDTLFQQFISSPSTYDFWKLSIQGMEWSALQKATKSLIYAKVIYITVYEIELYLGCKLLSDIDSFLFTHGFTRMITHMTSQGWGEALYLFTNSLSR